MKDTLFAAAYAVIIGICIGAFIGALMTSSANYTACLEKGLGVELCKEIRR